MISQIYGGGGNKGATLRNDFIELFNRSAAPVNITGWTVQHAAANGSSWDRTLLGGTIQPGHYFLVEEGQGSGGTEALPTPDTVGGIDISATSDKIALVSNSINLSGTAPSGAGIVDFVGYGSADAAEGQSAPALNNTTALLRRSGGCTYTNNNFSDFDTGAPNPRNSSSPTNPCSAMIVPPSTPQISAAGVVNAATFGTSQVAPGEIITIFGSNLGPAQLVPLQLTSDGLHVARSLAGTQVLFDDIPAPLLYTSTGQISAGVPFELDGRSSTTLQVVYEGQTSNPVPLSVVPTAPGIFTADASGHGQAAVLNQDYSINGAGNPAAQGSVIMIYATGAGQTTPSGEDGLIIDGNVLPSPIQSVTAQIGGRNADVLYAGAAPGLVSGVMQVNVKIDVAIGGAVPVVLSVGNVSSQVCVVVWVAP